MTKTNPATLAKAQEKRLAALAAASEETIDTSDIAELTAEDLCRPRGSPTSTRSGRD